MENTRKTIMLVEDEAIIAMDEAETLKDAGYNVITVSSGEAAVSTVNKMPDIDLILMDINLGRGMDGTEAAERILQNHEIPIVFLSSHTSPEVVAMTEKVTSYGYVVKNSGSTVLFASIRMAFRLNEAYQNLNLRREMLIRTLEERRQTEEKLYQSREMLIRSLAELQTYFSAFPGMVNAVDKDYNIINASDNLIKKVGFIDLESIVGKKCYSTLKNRDSICPECQVAKVLQTGEPKVRLCTPEEAELAGMWCQSYVYPIKNIEGVVIGAIQCLLDVTGQIKAGEALLESEQRFRSILNNIPDMAWLKDLEGRYIAINKTYSKVFGIDDPEKLVGMRDQDMWPCEQSSRFYQNDVEVITSAQEKCFEENVVIHGRTRCVETIKRPLLNSRGAVTGTVGISRDITEHKETREALIRAVDDREARLQELRQSMKNSLAIIVRLIDTEAGRMSESLRITVLHSLRKRVIAISDLYEMLFHSYNLKDIRLDQYLNQACSSLMSSYPQSSAGFELEVELDCISADVSLAIPLGLILNELIDNAVKHAFPEKRSGTVNLRLNSDYGRMIMSVSDNGVGLPPGFDYHAGRGLGMELINMLAEQIGAQVEHEISCGAIFRIVIPLTDKGSSDAHSPMKAAESC